jgi:hypothetical protein
MNTEYAAGVARQEGLSVEDLMPPNRQARSSPQDESASQYSVNISLSKGISEVTVTQKAHQAQIIAIGVCPET